MASGACSRHTRLQVSDLLLSAMVHSDSFIAELSAQSLVAYSSQHGWARPTTPTPLRLLANDLVSGKAARGIPHAETEHDVTIEAVLPAWVGSEDVKVTITADFLSVKMEGIVDCRRSYWRPQ